MKLTAKNLEKVLLDYTPNVWASIAHREAHIRLLAEHLAKKFKPVKPKTDPHLQGQAEHIYEFYPRKVARPAALRAILRQLKKYNADDLLAQTRRFAELWKDATKDQMQYLPHPATWYNQERFMDQIDIQGPKPGWRREPLRGENI